MCGYIRKSPKKAVVDGEDKHPYMKGYVEWVKLENKLVFSCLVWK